MAQATGSTAVNKTKRLSSSSLGVPKRLSGKTLRRPSNSGKTSKKGLTPSFPIEDFLDRRLADPEEAIGYLNSCLEEENPGLFLLALQDVIRAQGGMAKVSKKTHLNREGLYDMLSKKGNPRLSSLEAVLEALGLKLMVASR
jgi:probable addiction module antidote protein